MLQNYCSFPEMASFLTLISSQTASFVYLYNLKLFL